jgi:hypothetical protein
MVVEVATAVAVAAGSTAVVAAAGSAAVVAAAGSAAVAVDGSFAAAAASEADSSLAAVADNGTAVAQGEITTGEDETGVIAAAIMAVDGVATTERLTTAAMRMDRTIAVPAAITIAGETGNRTPAVTRHTGIKAYYSIGP